MFGNTIPKPRDANALRMLWTYQIKQCGTYKSRMVCDGNPRHKESITLGHVYANALDATSERLFWAIAAKEGMIAIGFNISNAFVEAPPPKVSLYLYIDDAYKQWWTEYLQLNPILDDCNVVQVKYAIQGHPESARLWEKHIDGILTDHKMLLIMHEPCLYSGIDHSRVLFLHQVDDFALDCKMTGPTETLIDAINQKMCIPVKHLGLITRFNGVDIHQTHYYIKITCQTYLTKMLTEHNWLDTITPNTPVPLTSDNAYTSDH